MAMVNRIFIARIACCLFGCLAMTLSAATAQTKKAPRYNVSVDVVSIDVEVLDDDGNLVPGLTADDFLVKENDKAVKIVNFARYHNRPVSLAMLLDTSTIELKKLNIAKQFILNIIHLLDRDDDIRLYSFDQLDACPETDYTLDRSELVDALESITVSKKRRWGFLVEFFGADPLTGLGINHAIRGHQKSNHPRKAILIISNRFRGLGPATVDHIRASRCTLYTLGFDNKSAAIASLGGDAMNKKQLMKESGGRKFSAETENIMGLSKKIVTSMKNYYSLGYRPDPETGKDMQRRIEVRVPDRDYTINARRSY